MGMSYRRAWLLVDDLNHCFDEPVVLAQHGGRAGGGAALTPFGQSLVEHFRAIEREAETRRAPHHRAPPQAQRHRPGAAADSPRDRIIETRSLAVSVRLAKAYAVMILLTSSMDQWTANGRRSIRCTAIQPAGPSKAPAEAPRRGRRDHPPRTRGRRRSNYGGLRAGGSDFKLWRRGRPGSSSSSTPRLLRGWSSGQRRGGKLLVTGLAGIGAPAAEPRRQRRPVPVEDLLLGGEELHEAQALDPPASLAPRGHGTRPRARESRRRAGHWACCRGVRDPPGTRLLGWLAAWSFCATCPRALLILRQPAAPTDRPDSRWWARLAAGSGGGRRRDAPAPPPRRTGLRELGQKAARAMKAAAAADRAGMIILILLALVHDAAEPDRAPSERAQPAAGVEIENSRLNGMAARLKG